ncbi:MAG: MiaB/RimO family radical SAM methylthiotransferase, partial [Desulfobacterales bacterium]|nr:MiaB/RimO family radical SAM methylthiotransferase [Desulfobacterales bacterium]
CDAFCAYCIIPYARGRSRSLTPEIIIKRIKNLKEQGYAEVVLCGINIGRYGRDLTPQASLFRLMQLIDSHQAIKRLRLSSIEPTELSKDLFRQLATSKHICPHLHVPLQSGDDQVLKSMNRPYNSQFYRDLIHQIITVMPDVAIGVDVLVGFPGETERAFENTCRLIEQLPIAYLHIFPFSMQKGTPAGARRDAVPPETIKKRCRHVRDIGEAKRRKFYEKYIGSTLEVVIEGNRDRTTGYLKGVTRNYIPVFVEASGELFRQVVDIRLTRIKHGRVFGRCLSAP